MGYTYGTKWTDELVEQRIKDAMSAYGIERMPTRSELNNFYGNSNLSNKIAKTYGFFGWADKLNLSVKDSETLIGYKCEKYIAAKLEMFGHYCELTSVKCPYDILVDGKIKVDVKFARRSLVGNILIYSFNLEHTKHRCDFYILYCYEDDKHYIIPSNVVEGQKQIGVGLESKKYADYLERWGLLNGKN